MKVKIKTLLREALENQPRISYTFEMVDAYDGQYNYELGMYLDGEIVGLVEYTLYEDDITISNIIVRPEFRRKGFGSRMIKAMKQKHPDSTYKPSMKTDLGAKFKHKDVDDIYSVD